MITSIILLIGIVTSTLGLFFKLQNKRLNSIVRAIHLFFLLLTIICIILLTKRLSFRGFYTDRIIISIWFATGAALYGLFKRGSINLTSRIYYAFFFFIPIFFLIAWFIPRLHFMAAVFGLGVVIDSEANRFPINDKFQLQEAFQGVLASSYPPLDLVENFGIFEKTTKAFVYRPENQIQKINFILLPNDSLKISVVTKNMNSEYSDTIVRLPK